MGKIGGFFSGVLSEMRKTSWPKRKELTKYTIIIVTTLLFMAAFFMVVDLGISKLLRWYLEL
ncbi:MULTISPECIES: preprotein translocase subunit SecE [Rummeliibacillus]|uniref:Protein translocase subunit SecE n=1 Tax=Rummeliibacillus stabekisii TaxID=241244 RepID=A0A143HFK5_9BACL|nr:MULTISPECIES: preprotein translocase subunit SecE [Rummeliibacillus]AMX00513.1 preprotein translocase subunit SecE [Rummeliibacillus stabekisii]MBB5171265.1 preprotein translocase subunit SecE [Rummeliibacillus stabekisii]MCM3317670.1 preprotein translocase subunit SecE [Rummeliibacillus stabekisii]GEL06032.1 protein translocase subunit SecE [Rummeliibacillus stabekisii]